MKLFEAIDAIKKSKLVADIKDQVKEELTKAKIELQEGFEEMKSDFKREIEAVKDNSLKEKSLIADECCAICGDKVPQHTRYELKDGNVVCKYCVYEIPSCIKHTLSQDCDLEEFKKVKEYIEYCKTHVRNEFIETLRFGNLRIDENLGWFHIDEGETTAELYAPIQNVTSFNMTFTPEKTEEALPSEKIGTVAVDIQVVCPKFNFVGPIKDNVKIKRKKFYSKDESPYEAPVGMLEFAQRFQTIQQRKGFIDPTQKEVKENNPVESAPKPNNLTADQSLEESMNELIGLSKVKSTLLELKDFAIYKRQLALENVSIPSSNMHMLFFGNPGTGKTVVARKMAKFLYQCGIIQEEKVVEVSRKDLVGGYVGQTAIKTDEKIREAMGGILFVDEAYTLYSDSSQDFGKEAVETIMKAMEDHRDQLIVIFAGYKYEMQKFLSINEGIASRIGFEFYFEDYSAEELTQIFVMKLQAGGLNVDPGCYHKLIELFEFYRQDPKFGNGRFVEKVISQTMRQRAKRHYGEKKTILAEDIPNKIV